MVLWTRGDVVNRTCLELTPTFQHEKTTMAIRYRPTLMIYHYPIDPEMGGVGSALCKSPARIETGASVLCARWPMTMRYSKPSIAESS